MELFTSQINMVLHSAIEAIMLFAFHAKVFSLILFSDSLVKNESIVAIWSRAPLDVHLAIKGLLQRVLVVLIHLVRAQTLLHIAFTNLSSAISVWTDEGTFSLVNFSFQKVIEAFLMKHMCTRCQRNDFLALV